MKYNAETIADKWFKRRVVTSKQELKLDIEQAIKEAVEAALYEEKEEDVNDPANFRIAIRETDNVHFVIYKDLTKKIPENWSVIIPNRGTLSAKYYDSEGNLLMEYMRKYKVMRSEAEINLNR
jgi:hypothetical protein